MQICLIGRNWWISTSCSICNVFRSSVRESLVFLQMSFVLGTKCSSNQTRNLRRRALITSDALSRSLERSTLHQTLHINYSTNMRSMSHLMKERETEIDLPLQACIACAKFAEKPSRWHGLTLIARRTFIRCWTNDWVALELPNW